MRCYICDYSKVLPSEYNQEEEALRERRMTWEPEHQRWVCSHCNAEGRIAANEMEQDDEVTDG